MRARQSTNRTGKRRNRQGLVTLSRDSSVTQSRARAGHVPRLRKGPHVHSPGSRRACARQRLALAAKGFKDAADRCKRRSVSLSRPLAQNPPIASKIAGKSSLLQILAGKKLIKGAEVTIKGLDVFHQFPEGVTFLGTEWSVT